MSSSDINIMSAGGGSAGGLGLGGIGGTADHPLLPMPMNMTNPGGQPNLSGANGPHLAGFNNFNNTNQYLAQQHQHQHQQQQHQQQQQQHHHPQQQQHQHHIQQHHGLGGFNMGPGMHHGVNSNPYTAAAAAAAAAVAAQSVTGYPIQSMDARSAVVQVSNFPDQIANPDALFTLFGVYGDILKVKIMYNRRDNALMQFKSCEQALNAVNKMDKVKLFDHIVSVGLSKFPEIQIPIKNDGGLAKDYITSPLHRFKKPGSKNFFNIYAPNQTLHLSNISQTTSQEKVQELFAKYGNIINFKWISKEGNKMALLELSTLEEAVLSLIALHNYQLNGSYLRVNFANKSGK
jgi:hnRNP-L/PTB/hephaestus splicing factor